MARVGVLAKHEIEYWEFLQDYAYKAFPVIFNKASKQGKAHLKKVFVHVSSLADMRTGYTHAIVLSYPMDVESKLKKDMVKFMTA